MSSIGHPPIDTRLMMDMHGQHRLKFQGVCEPKPYLDRDRDIVDATDLLIATPFHAYTEAHLNYAAGGTWYTVRYAINRGKPVKLIDPDGTVHDL
jgi:hypothetical protein